LPSKLKLIRSQAFLNSNLETITIPKSVEAIEHLAFASCKNLKKVIFEGSPTVAENAFLESDCEFVILDDSFYKKIKNFVKK